MDLLDPNALSEVRSVDADGTLLPEVIGIFYTDGRRLLTEIHHAVERGDTDAVILASHTLTSCSGAVGAQMLSAACSVIEKRARSERVSPAPEELQQLEGTFERSCDALAEVTGVVRAPAQVP